ncbi:unnamed protein product [Hanseniaspora opuntiae]
MGWLWNDYNKSNGNECATIGESTSSKSTYMKDNLKHILQMSASGKSVEGCPVLNPKKEEINPTNNMPDLRNAKQSWQKMDLPTEREISTIPKKDGSLWEYPSPQQMYNAMVRKGKIDSVLNWERFSQKKEEPDVKLVKFTGRPNDLTPRARFYHELSKLFPDKISGNLPFDRHDWFVQRSNGQTVRYVIDFYEQADDEETGEPVFSCDIRPGLDNVSNCLDRFKKYWFDDKS